VKPALHIVGPDEPAPAKPDIAPTHVVFQAAARNAFTGMEGSFNALRRIFAGPSASVTSAAQIDRLCAEIVAEAQRVKRWAR
jgi:hypothetical protein